MHETGHRSYMFTSPRDCDFLRIVEVIRLLAQKRIRNIPQLRHVTQELNVLGLSKAQWYSGNVPIPANVDSTADGMAIPQVLRRSWILFDSVFLVSINGSKFFLPSDLPSDHYIHSRALVCSGVPVLRARLAELETKLRTFVLLSNYTNKS
jgi:hypothetical protein